MEDRTMASTYVVEQFLDACVLYHCAGRDLGVAILRIGQALMDKITILGFHAILTGSLAEGMPEEACGDIDIMGYHDDWPTVLLDCPTADTARHILRSGFVIAKGIADHPAFARLLVPDITKLGPIAQPAVVQDAECSSSYLNGQKMFSYLEDKGEQHGPALALKIVNSQIDKVPCLRCPSWPPCTADFIHRHRPHGRPSQALIQKTTHAGCHLVPIAHDKKGAKRELEFRWSFSLAEKDIIHDMDQTMSAVMYILKGFKKCFWREDPELDQPTVMCSYFFKTACLWLNETMPIAADTSCLSLAKAAIQWLVSCYKEHNLPHYFIPDQNLIGHLPRDSCDEVARTLMKEGDRLELNIIRHFADERSNVENSSKADVCDIIKQQLNIPEHANLSSTENVAKFVTSFRSRENLRKSLTAAIARIRPGSDMYRRKALRWEGPFLSAAMWVIDIGHLISQIQSPDIHLTAVIEHLMMPIIDNLDNIVDKGCVAMLRSVLFRCAANLYFGLGITDLEDRVEKKIRLIKVLGDLFSIGPERVFFILAGTIISEVSPARRSLGSDLEPTRASGSGEDSLEGASITTPLPASNETCSSLSPERQCLAKAEAYYRRGIHLVDLSGYDDEGFSGLVQLAAFYYLNEEWDKARDTLDTELVRTWLDRLLETGEIAPASSYIYTPEDRGYATTPWRREFYLYVALLYSGRNRAEIHPAVLALYLQARLAFRYQDLPRAASALSRMMAMGKIEWQKADTAAIILTTITTMELLIHFVAVFSHLCDRFGVLQEVLLWND